MNYRENISELNENLKAFPEAEEVFSEKQPWLKDHFLPCISIDLAEINPEWAGTKLHLINPFEPYDDYIGAETKKFHNEFTGANWLAFHLDENNKYEFLGEEGYFLRTAINKWDFNGIDESYFKEGLKTYQKLKAIYKEEGYLESHLYLSDYEEKCPVDFLSYIGGGLGYANWVSAKIPSAFKLDMLDESEIKTEEDLDNSITITYNGHKFYSIAGVAGWKYAGQGANCILLMYEPISRIVLFTFDW